MYITCTHTYIYIYRAHIISRAGELARHQVELPSARQFLQSPCNRPCKMWSRGELSFKFWIECIHQGRESPRLARTVFCLTCGVYSVYGGGRNLARWTEVTHIRVSQAADRKLPYQKLPFENIPPKITFISQQPQEIPEIGYCQLVERMKLSRPAATRQNTNSSQLTNQRSKSRIRTVQVIDPTIARDVLVWDPAAAQASEIKGSDSQERLCMTH